MTQPDIVAVREGVEATVSSSGPILSVRGAELVRPLWSGLILDVQVGEFVAVLGPNGAGKTSS